MEKISLLFGESRAELIKLFILNSETKFETLSIKEKIKIDTISLKKELKDLEKINFINKKSLIKKTIKKNGEVVKTKTEFYTLNSDFSFLPQLKEIILSADSLGSGEFLKKIKKHGSINILIFSGFLIGGEGDIDIFISGDNLKKDKIEKEIESFGKKTKRDFSFVIFDGEEFAYRQMMFDKFLREYLSGDIKIILDKNKQIKTL